MKRVTWWKAICVVCVLFAETAIAVPAQTFTMLANFNGANGANPQSVSLVQGTDGSLYGTTNNGGAYGYGTVFKVSPSGTVTTLYSFRLTDGALPVSGLVLATDEDFYGTTFEGGTHRKGTVFKITSGGKLKVLHSFGGDPTEGANPRAALVQGTDGNFYGTTEAGGTSNGGTVFKITPGGVFTTLHSFYSTDGNYLVAALVQATDGDFYGTTDGGGTNNNGTIFKITSAGTLTTLHSFDDNTEGAGPLGGLVQASNGNFYGTTEYGPVNGYGTVFKITPSGTLTTLHSFDSADGAYPYAGLVLGTDGSFYGTTNEGGASGACTYGCGTVFKIAPGNTLTTLHSFDSADGAWPFGVTVQATNGTFYGTTYEGGSNGYGTVFSLDEGLGPFVKTLPIARRVGQGVIILGNNLNGSTRVSFNGTPAVFTVVSSTEIATTVPYGATTGNVQVVTPGGTLTSNVPFRVLP